ncbi:MAG: hypothetical protein HY426_02645 [Candidatus Levybacteria bacterium]|nr:hypothetical protein [Candidatus Levybacteria bacterium]
MNERVKDIGRIAFIAGILGSGLYQIKTDIDQQNRELDAMCGGPARSNCVRIETDVPVPHWDGTKGMTTIVKFIPKPTL